MPHEQARAEPSPLCAYVILSHGMPEQTSRLMAAIRRSSPASAIVVMHDARAVEAPAPLDDRTLVIEHGLPTDWGSWEIVAATLTGMRVAREHFDPAMVALLSGQDYPVAPLADWERSFLASGGGWIGDVHALRYRPRWGRPYGVGDDTFTRYHYRWYPLPFGRTLNRSTTGPARVAQGLLWRLGHYLEPAVDVRALGRGRRFHLGVRRLRSPFGRDTPCVKGSQWVAMDRAALDHLLTRDRSDRRLRQAFRHSIIPDESYLQTILNAYRPRSDSPPLTYVRWNPENDRPDDLVLGDLPLILASGRPFCRKVAPGISDDLMAALDERTPMPRVGDPVS